MFHRVNDTIIAGTIVPEGQLFGCDDAVVLPGFYIMGAKYLPTIKDLKASLRFQQKQSPLPKFKKASAPSAEKKRKGK